MQSPSLRSGLTREMQIEALETRVVMSGQSIADFTLDAALERVENAVEPGVDQSLMNAHDQSGLTAVRNAYGFTGLGQTVAIIDSGVAYDHAALGGGFGESYRVVGGWDFAENDANPYDDGYMGSHGTHVAGIVGSEDGVHTGVAPGVDIVGLRVFDDSGAGYLNWVEDALQWVHDNRNAYENPITTVNLSLGTEWNSDSIPSWAMLEDEFAQLEADGIFIAVAAGNSFTNYNATGLSYPAVSQYVVPVSSVDDAGDLSYFSQRHDRVIAAPGQGITSTVPDYVGNFNGQTDDFASFSGTSMASPYVAGSSVLLRQAYEFTGQTNVTQDQIYDLMKSTADSVWDAETGQSYSRLNLAAALDAIMPEDDFGSTVATAHDLGTLDNQTSFGGLIGTTTDQDFFTFTAESTGTISFTVDTNYELVLDAQLVDGTSTFVNNVLTATVAAGESYTISFGTNGGIGGYDVEVTSELAAATVKTLEHDGRLYSLDSDGWLSVDGTQVWSRTQDFSFADDGSMLWLSTNGALHQRTGNVWSLVGRDVVQYAVNNDNAVYSLDSDNWLSVNGTRVWSNTEDFRFGSDGSLYWLSTTGTLQHRTEQGWQTIDRNVTKFAVQDDGTVYSLDSDNWLSVNGTQVWSQTQDFALDNDTLYWLSTSGNLQRRSEGSWETIHRNVDNQELQSIAELSQADTDENLGFLQSLGALGGNDSAPQHPFGPLPSLNEGTATNPSNLSAHTGQQQFHSTNEAEIRRDAIASAEHGRGSLTTWEDGQLLGEDADLFPMSLTGHDDETAALDGVYQTLETEVTAADLLLPDWLRILRP